MSMDKHLIHAELIGKHATVVDSTNHDAIGIKGTIVDETKNTISIETATGTKKVQKHGTAFKIDGERVSGDDILAPPEERIKLKRK